MPTQDDTLTVPSRDRVTALGMSTLAFTVCFAVWTIFSIIGIQIKQDLGLTDTQFGLLVGTPILTGSLIRLILGIWADQYGGRIVYVGVMIAAAAATWLLTYAYDYPTFLLAALGVGIFASALTKSQLIAVVVGAFILVFLVACWKLAEVSDRPLNELFTWMSLHNKHQQPFMAGLINTQDVVFYVSLTYFFLFLATRVLESRRWSD